MNESDLVSLDMNCSGNNISQSGTELIRLSYIAKEATNPHPKAKSQGNTRGERFRLHRSDPPPTPMQLVIRLNLTYTPFPERIQKQLMYLVLAPLAGSRITMLA